MITFTPAAIAQWRQDHPESASTDAMVVRVSVAAGGCAGLKYVMEPVTSPAAGDDVSAHEGLLIVAAAADLNFLQGLTVDYVDAMVGGGYRFDNPNAGRSCGCGASFGDKAG